MRPFILIIVFFAFALAEENAAPQMTPNPEVLETLELLKKVGMEPQGFTPLGTPLFDVAEFNKRINDLKYFCTEGGCCDLTKKRFKEWGEACTLDPSTPCKRPAGQCLGASNTCEMVNMEDNTICPGGKCMNGACIIAVCDAGCCTPENTALPKGTKCDNGTCDAGRCVPEKVVVLQTNFLEDSTLKKPEIITDANQFDTEAYNTQKPVEEISPEDKKIYNRIDSVLDKFNSKKNNELKSILLGISEKEKRRAADLKKSEDAKAKKTAAFLKEVEEQKQRYAALEKLDNAQY